MKKWIGILAMVAFVVTTTVPVMSHAKPESDTKTEHASQAGEKHDCHHSKEQATKQSANSDQETSDKCCDKGVCKCVGGMCHNGLSKIFGNSGMSISAVLSESGRIIASDESGDSALLSRLKRPPRV